MAGWLLEYLREEERATSNMVVNESLSCFLLSKVLRRIWPKDVTH